MNQKIAAESENGSKKVCYLVVTHGVWVDQAAHVFKFLNHYWSDDSVDYDPWTAHLAKRDVPFRYFSEMTPEQRDKLLEYLHTTQYGHPGYGSISAFSIDLNNFVKPVFSRYGDHLSKTLVSAEEPAVPEHQEAEDGDP